MLKLLFFFLHEPLAASKAFQGKTYLQKYLWENKFHTSTKAGVAVTSLAGAHLISSFYVRAKLKINLFYTPQLKGPLPLLRTLKSKWLVPLP